MSETEKKASWLDNHKFAREHAELWKIVKYFLAGALGIGPELGSYMGFCALFSALGAASLPNFFLFNILAKNLAPDPNYTLAAMVYASILSTCVGQAVAFLLNRKVTFHANSNVALATAITAVMIVFTILANGFLVPMTISLFQKIPFLSAGLAQAVGKTIAMIWPNLWLYPVNRFVIHRVKKEKQADA